MSIALRRAALAAALFPTLSSMPALAQGCTGTPSATRLDVVVENVRSARGLIAITLYADDRSRFLVRRGSLYVGRVLARAPVTRACIHLPAPGTWALAVYHDEDSSRGINRDWIGRPTEGFGFTNNPSTLFSIPTFNSVRLHVPRTSMETTIRLRYR